MKQKPLHFFRLLIAAFFVLAGQYGFAQTSLTTTTTFVNNNGSGTVTFNLENTNSYDVIITDIEGVVGTAGLTSADLWYKTTPVNGLPGAISAANGWTQAATGTFTGVANTTTTVTQPFLTGLSFVLPAGATYGIAITAYSGTTGRQRYSTISAGTTTISAGGVNLIAGTNVSYGGGAPPTAPTNTPRGWIGTLVFIPAVPCTAPPTPGTAMASNTNPCTGSTIQLSLSGNSGGTGQTYEWESSASLGGPYTSASPSSPSPTANVTVATTAYYRAAVTCSGNTTYSTPVLVTVPTPFAGGNYTINSAVVTGGTNFQTFADAIAAISCGISGPVVFDVAIGSGPYVEQVTIPSTVGSSAANTVTINGNGTTVSFAGTAAAPHTFGLNGADYITVNDLNVEGTDATYALVCHLWNDADNNNFNNCTFTAPANSTATTTVPFCLNGSATTALTTGLSGNNNIVTGCTMNSGYYNTVFYGNSSGGNTGNQLINCNLKDFYFYGAMSYYQNGIIIRGNTIERPARTTLSTFYGVYVLTGTTNALVENNRIKNPFAADPANTGTAYGVYSSVDAAAGTENKYINNVISDFQGSGTHAGLYLTGADYLQAYHNTIAFNYSAATAGTTYGIYSTGSVGGIDIKNNNISITRGGTGTKYCLYFTNGFQTSDNNNLYMNAPAGTNYTGYFSTGQTLLSDWQLVNGGVWDAASVAVDPLFINPAAGDYTPANSLMDDLGTPVGVTTDINGAPRSATTPDIGAYEFSVPPCVGFPTPGTATANVTSVCASGPFSITLSGFTIGSGITIQWEESPAGLGTWVPITGANSATFNYTQTAATDYRAVVTCVNGGFSDVSNTVTIQMSPFFVCYCSPMTGNPLHSTTANYITNVTIPGTSLSASTSAVGAGGYTQHDYNVSTNTASLIQGQSYTLNASITNATYGTELWIDWDQSGTFDATEYQLLTPGLTSTTSITVPAAAAPGMTGMRLRSYVTTAHGASGACASLSSGRETEDFVITIAPAIQCAGVPSVTGTATISQTSICVNNSVELDVTGYTTDLGISIQWEESPAGQNNWSVIAGATTPNYTVTNVLADMDYRAAVICNNPGGGTGYSNTVSVVANNPQITGTTPGSRCGTGTVDLAATASPGNVVNWYDVATGGSPLGTGNNFTTPVISTTTTFYAAATTPGASAATMPLPAHGSNFTGNVRGFYFTAPTSFTITGLQALAQTTGNQSLAVVKFDNNTPPPIYATTTNAFTVLYLTQNNTNTGVIPVNIPINAGEVIGVLGQISNASSYATPTGQYVSSIAGLPVTLTRMGMQFPLTTSAPQALWEETNGAIGRVLIEYQDGCEGLRVPVAATVTAAPGITATATPDTICLGSSATLDVTSSNAGYSYTWTPGGSGSTISVSPTTTTSYEIVATDASNCTQIDTIEVAVISVPATVAAVASSSTICVAGSVDLSLDPMPMAGITVQWQKNTGSGFVDIPGATTALYTDPVTANSSYQANIYCDNSLVTTSSPVTVSYSNPMITEVFPGSRCDAGPVTLVATADQGADINWYTAATGGSPVGTGGAYTTPSIAATTTYYVAASTSGGSSGASPIQVTEVDLGGNDKLEIQNVSGAAVNVTGWKVFISDSYTNINLVNANVQTLSGTMNPGDILSWTDLASATNYWGSNMFWNPGAFPSFAGWAAILDNNNTLVDVVFWSWLSANIQSASWTVGTATITVGTQWSGDGINTTTVAATDGVSRQGVLDNNNAADFAITPLSIGTSNPGLTLPMSGFGCEGARVPVAATINGVSSGTGLSTGGTTTGALQPDGTTIDYNDGCGDKVATVTDPVGGNTLGITSAVVVTSATVETHNGRPFVPRVFDITPASTGAATVTLYALQSEFDAYNNYVTANSLALPLLPTGPLDLAGTLNIVITQYHGDALSGNTGPMGLYTATNSTFIPNTSIVPVWTGSYWSMTFPVSGFSGFFIHSGANTLSIQLGDISAGNFGSRNRVDWNTLSEHPGDYFILERSADAAHFTALGRLDAKGMAANYSYWDEHPFGGVNHYRLKMFDASGAFTYSKVVTAEVKGPGVFTLQAAPNPVGDDVLNIEVFGQTAGSAIIMVSDITGKMIKTVSVVNNNARIDMSGLAQGTYLIRYTDAVRTETIKVNKH